MRKILVLCFLYSSFCPLFAQSDSNMTVTTRDSILTAIFLRLDNIVNKTEPVARYKLYKTENLYNLLKLDTATGRIEQLQWSLDDDKEGTMTINSENLSLSQNQPGTFELYPTNNMYQFILLDKVLGRTWHVQWGIGSSKRWIKRIW